MDKITYLEKLENTIAAYRIRAVKSRIPWLWNFLADTLSNTVLFERQHQKMRGYRKEKGWKEYTKAPFRKLLGKE